MSQITKDEALAADLARAGVVVDRIVRQPEAPGPKPRLIVYTHVAKTGIPLVAVVDRGHGELDNVFARIMTKLFVGPMAVSR